MNRSPMNLVIAINSSYVKYAYVMLFSLLTNNPVPVHIYVFHHELTSEDEDSLRQLSSRFSAVFHFVYVPDELLPSKEILATSGWGIEAYFRLAITDLLPPDVERALYLDTDMIVNASITDFYRCGMKGCVIAACKEFTCTPPFGNYRDTLFAPLFADGFCYFNSGTILYDLTLLRQKYSFHTYMETARSLNYEIQYPDQDLLNYCHYRETLFVDTFKYNLNARYGFDDYGIDYNTLKQNGIIVHYASSKPWRGNFLHYNVEQLWWDYAKGTPFYRQLLEEALRENIMDSPLNIYITDLLQQNNELYARIDQYEHLLAQTGGTLL